VTHPAFIENEVENLFSFPCAHKSRGFLVRKLSKIRNGGVCASHHSDMSVNPLTIADMGDQEPKQKEDSRNYDSIEHTRGSWLSLAAAKLHTPIVQHHSFGRVHHVGPMRCCTAPQ
jgi:hypothetical protein